MIHKALVAAAILPVLAASPAFAQDTTDAGPDAGNTCQYLTSYQELYYLLQQVITSNANGDDNGSVFKPKPSQMWAAIVDRTGHLCAVAEYGDAWPGSRAIAIAKAETANDFSNIYLALSTANLYGPTQPGGSLYGLNNSNPFNPRYLPQNAGFGLVPGGIITFGGGVPLYYNGQVIGGLGVSGDTSCADHAIAYRMRALTPFASVPAGVGPNNTDNINYGTPSSPGNGYYQPHCTANDITP